MLKNKNRCVCKISFNATEIFKNYENYLIGIIIITIFICLIIGIILKRR